MKSYQRLKNNSLIYKTFEVHTESKYECAKINRQFLVGKEPDPNKAKSAVWNLMRTDGGNKIREAARQEILDRNASEGIEPRNS